MDGNAEDVSEFLLRIRELGDRRDREDDERARKLEAEILAGREARRARREERARSLSPQKDSPVGTPLSLQSSLSTRPGTRDGEDASEHVDNSPSAALDKLTGKLAGGETVKIPSDSPGPAPVLSWQRRPKSAYGLSKIPPLSPPGGALQTAGLTEKSQAQIAASLSTKDPAWFRQTQDRAATSGALKKAGEDGLASVPKKALPGMSPPINHDSTLRSSTPEPEKGPPQPAPEALSTARVSRSGSLQSDRVLPPTAPVLTSSHQRSPSLTSNPSGRVDPEPTDGFARPPPMSPSQGRISPERERTPSPTKGFGGFVQSAMLKREGSINKRWSRPDPGNGGLARNNSSSVRSSYTARSAAGDSTVAHAPAPEELTPEAAGPGDSAAVRTLRGRSNTTSEGLTGRPASFHVRRDSTPPASPTKAHEQKRWSPTKSSWLETALKKGTDNPQPPMAPAKPVERKFATDPPSKPSVTPKPPTLSPKPVKSEGALRKAEDPNAPAKPNNPPSNPAVADKPVLLTRSTILPPPTPVDATPKPKELNFRANLKPRPTTDKAGEKEELPFLNAMSRLRSTRTQNYKAPNELKDRILEGKAKLNTTGGPQRSARPDPLKESILTAKVSLKPSDTSPTRTGFSPTEKSAPPPFEKNPPTPAPAPAIPGPEKKVFTPGRVDAEKKAPPPPPPPPVRTEPEKKAFTPGPEKKEFVPGAKTASLADRFSSNLSNFLQRGPPVAASGNSVRKSPDDISPAQGPTPLTHMTKGRARGPKRRAPTKVDSRPLANQQREKTNNPSHSPRPIEGAKKPSPALSRQTSSSSLSVLSAQKSDKPKPPTPAKSPLLRGASSSSLKGNEEYPGGPAAAEATKTPLSPEPSIGSLGSVPPVDPTPPTGTPPIVLPKRGGERKSLGIPGLPGFSSLEDVDEPVAGKPLPRLFSRTVTPLPEETDSNSTVEMDNTRLLTQFFRGPPFRCNIDFDTMGILTANPASSIEKVKTLSFELSELTGYGKLNPVPREEQHVLFDESIYLCVHRFKTLSAGETTEVYLWSGVNVAASATEDAQLFARKTTREREGKLVQLKQGRETPTFFQAIGGMLITRRGTRANSSADSSFMLCGRKCFGGVAFDEVDMRVANLCSGFPFIVSRKRAVYLWKGRGATPDEIGVARLVGFEVSGGEVKEFAEGDEPDDFFTALGGYAETTSADYWHLKPVSRKYAARLFKMDLQTQAKVVELAPFCQDDLDPHEIYVADAFFEFYIVIGSQSQSRREEFQAALQFTEAYSLLAVSVEDRPFIPVSSVILGGAPREFKTLFRTWDDAKTPTQWQPARKPSLRLVGLPQAIEAMNH